MECAAVIVGSTWDRLTVVAEAPRRGKYRAVRVRCVCGGEKDVIASNLANGSSRSCGCISRERVAAILATGVTPFGRSRLPENVAGERYGRMTVLAKTRRVRTSWLVNARCECGTEKEVYLSNLKAGMTQSCGCLWREARSAAATTHGLSKTVEYHTWVGMVNRCEDPAARAYRYYGARGIGLCAGWRASVESFVADMGPRPEGGSIDRVDNNGGYWCGKCEECVALGRKPNCRWVDSTAQARNTSRTVMITVGAEQIPASALYQHSGVSRQLFFQRLAAGWPAFEAATVKAGTPEAKEFRARLDAQKKADAREGLPCTIGKAAPDRVVYTAYGQSLTLPEWAAFLGVSVGRLYARLRAGHAPDEVFDPRRLHCGRKIPGARRARFVAPVVTTALATGT